MATCFSLLVCQRVLFAQQGIARCFCGLGGLRAARALDCWSTESSNIAKRKEISAASSVPSAGIRAVYLSRVIVDLASETLMA